MPTNTTLRNVTSINESLPSDNIEANLIGFFSWGFLNIGGFFNAKISTSGAYGGEPYKLRLSEDGRYTKGQVWEGFRKDWVWESGTECPTQPISISGVNVGSTFYPLSTTGAFAYKIDYPNGRVVFTSAINPSSTVTCEHSYRYVQINNPDAPWWKKLQENSFRIDNPQFNLYGSGAWSIPPEQRVQLPAIVIQSIPNIKSTMKELGGLGHWRDQEVRYYILTETNADLKFLVDVVTNQEEKSLIGFNKNLMVKQTGFPLNYDGSLSANAKCYPDLIKPASQNGFEWKTIRLGPFRSWLDDGRSSAEFEDTSPFYRATLSGRVLVDVP